MNDEERFLIRVAKQPEGCWIWMGGRKKTGYGSWMMGKKAWNAHRFAYTIWVGPIPDGLEIDHLCAHPPCVNPAHLEAVTHAENVRRWVERRAGWCRSGKHDTSITGRYSDGRCRQCALDANRIPGAIRHGEKTHCPKGHPLSGENLRIIVTGRGGQGRRCRECDREASARAYRKRSGTDRDYRPRQR